MKLKTRYDVTISLLSPLHIGSGRELLRDYDYVTHAGKTWVLDADAFLEYLQRPDGSFDPRLLGRPASELLQDGDYQEGSPFFRYILPGAPRAAGHAAVLREQYKDAFGRPYIPGSSLKGALRTVLAWHGFQERNDIRSGRSWAGQGLERAIFGRDPNHDLLRGVQVADSEPQSPNTLRIINAQVVTGSEKMGSPVELEAVYTDTVFHTTITVDEFLHGDAAEAELHFRAKWAWLAGLPAIARSWAAEQLAHERDWHRQRKYDSVGRLFHKMLGLLQHNELPLNQFFLQIGWGGGWPSKTIGYPLQQDTDTWERLLNDKHLSPARIRRAEGAPFPKSRRVWVNGNQVAAPLGWCLVEMKERT